jgi:hypothetical protein
MSGRAEIDRNLDFVADLLESPRIVSTDLNGLRLLGEWHEVSR